MVWNDTTQQLASQEGLDLKADLAHLDFEWCVPPPTESVILATMVDMDNLSLPSFQTALDGCWSCYSSFLSFPIKSFYTF